jgi:hypothetical protein
MVQGFNHNIRYGGRVFHVQTEDSGLSNPHIVTHLYHGGIIVASRKTSYADILTHERRDQVIREIMKEQHRQMLLDLRDGRLDGALAAFKLAPDGKAAPPRAAPAKAAPAKAMPPQPKPPSRSAGEPEDDRPLDDILLDYIASRTTPADRKR